MASTASAAQASERFSTAFMKKIQELRAPSPEDRDALPLYHGGDLAAARRLFPGAPEPWIDLSTGINPEPYPIPHLSLEVFSRLPDVDGLKNLEQAAARRYGAKAGTEIVAAPGTQALIQLLPQLLPQLHKPQRIGILGFTYGEYGQVWRAAGLVPEVVEDLDALARCDLAIIVNPNNPDGRLLPAADLSALAIHLAHKGGLLVVDEAFMDLLPQDKSLVPILPEAGALVLRSFGKTYGLAGLRLGFAIAGIALAERLRALLGPWAVSGPAIAIGQTALEDTAWLDALRPRLARRSDGIEAVLTTMRRRTNRRRTALSSLRASARRKALRGFRPRRRAAAALSRAAELAARRPCR